MSGSRKRPWADAVVPEMNVTPLVDVVLVLLIIFMVVAPRLAQDVQVDLPGIFHPDPEQKNAVDPLKVTVAKVGEYYINEQVYDLEGAIDWLTQAHAEDPDRRLVLRADAKLKYGDVRAILARTQAAGFPGVSLMVGERHQDRVGANDASATAAAPSQGG